MAEKNVDRGILSRFRNAVFGEKQAPKKAVNPATKVKTLSTSGHPPDGASGWGNDSYGTWLEVTVSGVTQRMRWIKPGCFLMGSPEDEPMRNDGRGYSDGHFGEGPRHKVQISQGFWLFDTPVTQAMWQAVMGGNPSGFIDPKRPVEQVSWDDAMAFIERFNARGIADLKLALPTEAQWEYACRAGTDTATYAGPIEILGPFNAPVLDAIAWYGGNNGEEFERMLSAGVGNSSPPQKQHEPTRTGTRPVGLKKPNAWGCHDMLGNVWEWCADDVRKYSADPVTDPIGSLESAQRAIRGGSCGGIARSVPQRGRP